MKKMFEEWTMFEKGLIIIATLLILGLSIYWGDTLLGTVSAVTGVICVILTAKGKSSCYLFGLINILGYIIISWQAKFYGEVMLNGLYYLPMQFVGLYAWKRAINPETQTLIKLKMSPHKRSLLISSSIVCIIVYARILNNLGGSMPYADSLSTVLSVFAMYLSVKRYAEQWAVWIVVNIASIIMWATTIANGGSDIATLLMWVTYLVNAVYGYIKWTREAANV